MAAPIALILSSFLFSIPMQTAVITSAIQYFTPTCSKGITRGKKKIEKIMISPRSYRNLRIRQLTEHVYGAVDFSAGRALPIHITLFCFLIKMFQFRLAAFGTYGWKPCPQPFQQPDFVLSAVRIHRLTPYSLIYKPYFDKLNSPNKQVSHIEQPIYHSLMAYNNPSRIFLNSSAESVSYSCSNPFLCAIHGGESFHEPIAPNTSARLAASNTRKLYSGSGGSTRPYASPGYSLLPSKIVPA